jgi:hypothetical protein
LPHPGIRDGQPVRTTIEASEIEMEISGKRRRPDLPGLTSCSRAPPTRHQTSRKSFIPPPIVPQIRQWRAPTKSKITCRGIVRSNGVGPRLSKPNGFSFAFALRKADPREAWVAPKHRGETAPFICHDGPALAWVRLRTDCHFVPSRSAGQATEEQLVR